MSETLLKSLLEKVDMENVLDVKEKMAPVPNCLSKFLERKFKSSSLRDQYAINDLFDMLLPHIKDLYNSKLKHFECTDEFEIDQLSLDKIVAGTCLKDGLFYEKTFVPAALFFVYKQVHNFYDKEEDLLEDIFTIGAGSMTDNLVPEVVPVCEFCIHSLSGTDEQYNSEDVDNMNKIVLKKQVSDKFILEDFIFNIESSVSSHTTFINPFSNDILDELPAEGGCYETIDSDESEKFECELCRKQFTQLDFVQYHKRLFHKSNINSTKPKESSINKAGSLRKDAVGYLASKTVKTKIVEDWSQDFMGTPREHFPLKVTPIFMDDEDSEMMQTFIKENSQREKEKAVVEVKKRKRGVRNALKCAIENTESDFKVKKTNGRKVKKQIKVKTYPNKNIKKNKVTVSIPIEKFY